VIPEALPPKVVVVQADGTVELPPGFVPVSKFLTPEAKAYLTQLHDMQDSNMTYADKGVPRFMVPYLDRQKALFAVRLDEQRIAGVHVFICTPTVGVAGCERGLPSGTGELKHDLPRPGAIGIFCASAGEFGSDAAYTSTPLSEARLMPEMRDGG
jgi:hypothetical protein